jgi:DUF2934 family protein
MSRSLAIQPTSQPKQQRSLDDDFANRQEKIRQRAYELYQARGAVDGYHEDDWYQAENELLLQDSEDRAA